MTEFEHTKKVGILALRGLTLLPGMKTQIDVSRERSIAVAKRGLMHGQPIFLVTQRQTDTELPGVADLYTVGVLAKVTQITRLNEKVYKLQIEVESGARLTEMLQEEPYLSGIVEICEEEVPEGEEELRQLGMREVLHDTVKKYLHLEPTAGRALFHGPQEEESLSDYIYRVAGAVEIEPLNRQTLLEQEDVIARAMYVTEAFEKECRIQEVKAALMNDVKQRIDKEQKEYVLRQQQRIINEQLGQDGMSEADEYAEKAAALDAPPAVHEKLEREIRRLRRQAPASPEGALLQNYIETVLEMPWNVLDEEVIDLKKVREILDRDHYGMKKVKDRIEEYLAVRKLTGKGDSPILCLIGPAGTGKTSIARSVAEALGRKYVRVSLGGVHDEADIRGHRKTYIGAMMGRIATAIKQAGVRNPLILLDEIDKMASDYKGDPSSAMLEVLDSEQNHAFRDHFLELDLDLSDVLFIATANDADYISDPLYDRMDVLYLEGYSANEKFHIAKNHLLAKQLERAGLTAEQVSISDEVLRILIRGYVREAGVRALERRIAQLCRKAAKRILSGEECVKIETAEDVKEMLGRVIYDDRRLENEYEMGIVNGLAWTSVGGVILQIEANPLPGKGEVSMTGRIGKVMEESARIGYNYLYSFYDDLGIAKEEFEEFRIHIHIPEGATPKDGPSAGISMALAMMSVMTGRKVRQDVAMTGEITLRGHVLPIGGLKEKLLAAKMEDMKLVILPEKNRAMFEELDEEIYEGMEIRFVKEFPEVVEIALLEREEPEKTEEQTETAPEGQAEAETAETGTAEEAAAVDEQPAENSDSAQDEAAVTEVPHEEEEEEQP